MERISQISLLSRKPIPNKSGFSADYPTLMAIKDRSINKASDRNKHTKWHGRPAHVLTGETPVPRDRCGSISTAFRLNV